MPPAEEWRGISAAAAAAAAASAGASRGAGQQLHTPPPPQLQNQLPASPPATQQERQQQQPGHGPQSWPVRPRMLTESAVSGAAAMKQPKPAPIATAATPTPSGRWADSPAVNGFRERPPSPRRPSPSPQRPAPLPQSSVVLSSASPARSRTPVRQLSVGVTGTPRQVLGLNPGRVSESGRGYVVLRGPERGAGGGRVSGSGAASGPGSVGHPPAPTRSFSPVAIVPGSYAALKAASASASAVQGAASPPPSGQNWRNPLL